MISISSVVFDLNGSLVLPRTEKSNLSNAERRVTRTATLDGGVVLSDLGYTDGDRTLQVVSIGLSLDEERAIRYLQSTYPLVILTCREGGFLGSIQSMGMRSGETFFSFLVKEKITED